MNEHIVEVLEDLFPDGCIVIYRNTKKDDDKTDCFGVYVGNQKMSESLDDFSSFIIDALEGAEKNEESDQDEE